MSVCVLAMAGSIFWFHLKFQRFKPDSAWRTVGAGCFFPPCGSLHAQRSLDPLGKEVWSLLKKGTPKIWVNCFHSLTKLRPFGDDFLYSPIFQWGRNEVVIICWMLDLPTKHGSIEHFNPSRWGHRVSFKTGQRTHYIPRSSHVFFVVLYK